MAKYIKVLDSASRSVATDSPKFENYDLNEAAIIVVDVTSGSNLVVAVKGADLVSQKAFTLLTSSVIASGTTVLRVGPAYTAAANTAKDYLPAEWYVTATVSGATTFSIGASII